MLNPGERFYPDLYGLRVREMAALKNAAANLGSFTLRVIEDPEQSYELVRSGTVEHNNERFKDEFDADPALAKRFEQLAEQQARAFLKTMEPNDDDSQRRLVVLTPTDGNEVPSNHVIYNEIKFRSGPGTRGDNVTTDEVIYGTINPVNFDTVFEQERGPVRLSTF